MKLKCIRSIQGFTVGEIYELNGCAGEYVEIEDDDGNKAIVLDGYFEEVKEEKSC